MLFINVDGQVQLGQVANESAANEAADQAPPSSDAIQEISYQEISYQEIDLAHLAIPPAEIEAGSDNTVGVEVTDNEPQIVAETMLPSETDAMPPVMMEEMTDMTTDAMPVMEAQSLEMSEPILEAQAPAVPPMEVFEPEVVEVAATRDFENLDKAEDAIINTVINEIIDETTNEVVNPNGPLGEVLQFANQSSTAGALVYTLTIKGIDHGDLRTRVLEVLSNSRFGWRDKKFFQNVQSGILRLEKISPAQAMMTIKLLKSLPVQVEWRQHIYEA